MAVNDKNFFREHRELADVKYTVSGGSKPFLDLEFKSSWGNDGLSKLGLKSNALKGTGLDGSAYNNSLEFELNSGGGVLSVVPEVELQSYKYNAGNKIRTDGFKSSILYKNDSYINSNKFKVFDNFFFQAYVGIDGKVSSK